MAAKSIITIDVDDSQFREFNALFQKYQKQLEGMPDDWKKAVDVIGEGADEMGDFAKSSRQSKEFLMISAIQADAISKGMTRATGVQDKFNVKLKDGSIQMERMAKNSQGMHKDLLKMSGLSTKMTAFGVGGMAAGAAIAATTAAIKAVYGATSTVASQNLESKGLGLNIGQTQAFDANFKKYGIDSSALGNVQSMIGNPASWGTLAMSGVNPTTAQNQPVDQVAFNILKSESDRVRGWKESGQNAAFLFGQNYPNSPFNFQQASAAASYPRGDLASSWAKEQADAKNNFISRDKGDTAADAMAQLQADHDKVMNSFNSALVNATPALTALANAVSRLSFWTTGGSDAKSSGKGVSPSDIGQGNVASGAITGGNSDGPQRSQMDRLLDAQFLTESNGGDPKWMVSPAGAKGPYQFMDRTWGIYGKGGNVMNYADSRSAAGQMDDDLSSKYGGDISKIIAAYNWGMGSAKDPRLDADIAKYGNNWLQHAPKETQGSVSKIMALMANPNLARMAQQKVTLNINNSTSANVATSANAAGY